MTAWDLVLAACIVLGVFVLGRRLGFAAGRKEGFELGMASAFRRLAARHRSRKPPTRPG